MITEVRILKDIGRVRDIEMGADGYIYVGVEDPGRIIRLSIANGKVSPSGKKYLDIDSNKLLGCWAHSYEEEAGEQNRKFRPCDFQEFGPSRFRRKIELQSGGVCQYLALSRSDKHAMKTGKWILNKENLLSIFDEEGQVVYKWRVMQLDDDLIRFRFL